MKKLIIIVLLVLAYGPSKAQEKFIVVQDAPMSYYYFLPFVDNGEVDDYDCIYNTLYGLNKHEIYNKMGLQLALLRSPFVPKEVDDRYSADWFNYKIEYHISNLIINNDTIPCDTMVVSNYCISNSAINDKSLDLKSPYKRDYHITRSIPITKYREYRTQTLDMIINELRYIKLNIPELFEDASKLSNYFFDRLYYLELTYIKSKQLNKKIIPLNEYKEVLNVKKWTETENLQFKHLYD